MNQSANHLNRKGAKSTKDAKEEQEIPFMLLSLCDLRVLCAFAVQVVSSRFRCDDLQERLDIAEAEGELPLPFRVHIRYRYMVRADHAMVADVFVDLYRL